MPLITTSAFNRGSLAVMLLVTVSLLAVGTTTLATPPKSPYAAPLKPVEAGLDEELVEAVNNLNPLNNTGFKDAANMYGNELLYEGWDWTTEQQQNLYSWIHEMEITTDSYKAHILYKFHPVAVKFSDKKVQQIFGVIVKATYEKSKNDTGAWAKILKKNATKPKIKNEYGMVGPTLGFYNAFFDFQKELNLSILKKEGFSPRVNYLLPFILDNKCEELSGFQKFSKEMEIKFQVACNHGPDYDPEDSNGDQIADSGLSTEEVKTLTDPTAVEDEDSEENLD